MYIDALTVGALRDELRAKLLGGLVERVFLTSELSVGFEFWANHRRQWLFASAENPNPRLHLASARLTRESDKVSPFLLLLRKYARHARLTAVEQPDLERMLILNFARRDDDGEQLEVSLMVELMGRLSNLILVNSQGVVLDAVKRVTSAINRVRTVLPAEPYMPPPPQTGKLNPLSVVERADLPQLAAELAAGKPTPVALVAALRGVSPLVAREISQRALGNVSAPVESLDVARWRQVEATLVELFAPLTTGEWSPSLARDADGQPIAFAPYRLTPVGAADAVEPVESISQALDLYFGARETIRPWSGARNRLKADVEEHRERANRKLEALERALVPPERLETLRTHGEWTLGLAHTVQRGQRELIVPEAGLRIALDPNLSAVENAQAFFREYAKAKSAMAGVPELIEGTRAQVEYLNQALALIETANGLTELEELRGDLVEAGFAVESLPGAKNPKPVKFKPSRGRPNRAAPKGQRMAPLARPRLSTDGFEILIGRSGRQNDEVTFGRGVGDDVWLHARGVPGAHVLIKTRGRAATDHAIREAAGLAAYHSQSRQAGSAPVDVTLQKHVRRIKGAPPGLVTYTHEYTIHVEPTAEPAKSPPN